MQVRQEFMEKLRAKQAAKSKEEAEKNQKEGDEFLAKNKSQERRESHRIRPAVRSRQGRHRHAADQGATP